MKVAGAAEPGATVTVWTRLAGKVQPFVHRILTVDEPREFRWCDVGWMTRLAYGERTRVLSAAAEGTRYHVEVTVTGPLAWVAGWLYGPAIADGIRAEGDALQRRAEEHAPE